MGNRNRRRRGMFLALDAAVVPVVYRIRVAGTSGEVLAEATHTCLPSEIAAAAQRAGQAFDERAATVDYWEA